MHPIPAPASAPSPFRSPSPSDGGSPEAARRRGPAITLLTSASSGAGDVALIVHPKNPVADLTRAEVVAIF
jgi:hypothetical protein